MPPLKTPIKNRSCPHREQPHAQTLIFNVFGAGVPLATPNIPEGNGDTIREEKGDTIPEENGDTSPEETGDTIPEENGDTSPATVKGNVEGKKETGWYFCAAHPSMKRSS